MLIEMSRKKFNQFERYSCQIRFATMKLKVIILLVVIPMVLGNFATNTINGNGYPVEIHTITTKDGYILNTYRIPCGRKCVKPNIKPVLLVHGMSGSCEQFMMLGNNSLAFLLADQGYDVWMMNVRGTDHSRKHKYLTGKQYWDFSWHEIALYDLAENIDYILNYTKSSELFYVCHSMGCTVLMVLASEKPEYNTKIKLAQCMAPGVLLYHFKNGMLLGLAQLSDFFSVSITETALQEVHRAEVLHFAEKLHLLDDKVHLLLRHSLKKGQSVKSRYISPIKYLDGNKDLSNSLRLYELPLPDFAGRDLIKTFCFRNDDFYKACQTFVSSGGGDVMHYPNKVNLENLFSFFPQPMSIRQILHFAQVMRDGAFQKYNYGSKKNIQIYGKKSPPPYNLSRVVVPVVLYASKGDSMVAAEGVRALSTVLPNVVTFNEVEPEKFNHNDYVMAPEAKNLVFDKILWYFLQFMK